MDPAGHAAAAEETAESPEEVIRRMGRALAEAPALSFSAEIREDLATDSGQLAEFGRRQIVRLARPGRLALDSTSPRGDWSVRFNRGDLLVMDKQEKALAAAKTATEIGPMLEEIQNQYGLHAPLSDFLVADPAAALLSGVQSSRYLGRRLVNQHACHHLAFRGASLDWQIWIDAGGVPVPRRLAIIHREEPGAPRFTADLDDWDLETAPPEESFTIDTPPEYTQLPMGEWLKRESLESTDETH
jgi:hypothetical protein